MTIQKSIICVYKLIKKMRQKGPFINDVALVSNTMRKAIIKRNLA